MLQTARMDEGSSDIIYQRPPITEATIEFRFESPVNQAGLKKANDRLAGRYDDVSSQQKLEAKLEFQTQSATFHEVSPMLRFTSRDQTDVLRLENQIASWSRLAPYEGWVAFSDRMTAEFEVLSRIWKARKISRIGLRYINRIDVPVSANGICKYEQYLAFKIDVPSILDPLVSYQWMVQKEHFDLRLKSMVQSAAVEPQLPGTMAFTLDIDIGCDVDVPQRHDDILAKLQEMRALKNEIFEAGITEHARKAFA